MGDTSNLDNNDLILVTRVDANGVGTPGAIDVDAMFDGVGVGYSSGGAVTQATNKATGVTLSTMSGQITMNNAALAADAIVSFVLTNTKIEAGDVLVLNHISGGTPGAYVLNARCAAGSATIDVANRTAGILGEAIVIAFAIIRAASA